MSERDDMTQRELFRQALQKQKLGQNDGKGKVKTSQKINSKASSHQSSRLFRRKSG